MEVRDVFAMRKDGRYEEAYKAISSLYAFHRGPHTNLCMFWCTHDLFKLRLQQKRVDDARQLLYQLVQLYSQIDDRLAMGNRAIVNAALALDKQIDNFNLIYFMPYFNRLTETDWQPYVVQGHTVPSLGQQVVNHLLKNLPARNAAYIDAIADIFHKAFVKAPNYKGNLRHLAQMHALVGQNDKAISLYKRMLLRYHDSYLYVELSKLVTDEKLRLALCCMAVVRQRRPEYAARYHLELAVRLKVGYPHRAAYELQRYIEIRQHLRQPVSAFAQRMQRALQGVVPVTAGAEQMLYDRAEQVVNQYIQA